MTSAQREKSFYNPMGLQVTFPGVHVVFLYF